jgi:hypothetical protein
MTGDGRPRTGDEDGILLREGRHVGLPLRNDGKPVKYTGRPNDE